MLSVLDRTSDILNLVCASLKRLAQAMLLGLMCLYAAELPNEAAARSNASSAADVLKTAAC